MNTRTPKQWKRMSMTDQARNPTWCRETVLDSSLPIEGPCCHSPHNTCYPHPENRLCLLITLSTVHLQHLTQHGLQTILRCLLPLLLHFRLATRHYLRDLGRLWKSRRFQVGAAAASRRLYWSCEEVTSTSTAEDRALDWRCHSIANVALRCDYLSIILYHSIQASYCTWHLHIFLSFHICLFSCF